MVTTHVNPDGDGIGSEMALHHYLLSRGKCSAVVNPSPLPVRYRFLDPDEEILVYPGGNASRLLAQADVILITDNSNWGRLAAMERPVRDSGAMKVVIDHHRANHGFADLDIVVQDASATGEVVYDLLEELGAEVTPRIAQSLYVAIATDTGSFRYSNTTPRAHEIAGRLLQIGLDPEEIHGQIYGQEREARFRLLARALATLHLECDGRLAWFIITKEMLGECGAHYEDTEGFAELPRAISEVQMVLLFKELEDKRVKVSLRSTEPIDVNLFSRQFSGGGHKHAAGIVMDIGMDESINRILEAARRFVVKRSLEGSLRHGQASHRPGGG